MSQYASTSYNLYVHNESTLFYIVWSEKYSVKNVIDLVNKISVIGLENDRPKNYELILTRNRALKLAKMAVLWITVGGRG